VLAFGELAYVLSISSSKRLGLQV